jgi:succinate-semialdehyde dehydrogenase / glutarate-semialdehyde dehydrogenase
MEREPGKVELRVAIVGGCVPVEKIETHIADAAKKGAKVAIGGKRHPMGGTFFEPTVLTDVTTDMVITKGRPSAPLRRSTALRPMTTPLRGPTTPHLTLPRSRWRGGRGLAACVYSRDIGRIWPVAEGLEYGMVGLNEGIISTEIAPFGGMKESGIGREGSKYGIEEFLEVKYLCMGGIDR